MFCQNCGTFLENGTKFCPNCGAPVAAPEIVREPVVPQETIAPQVEEPTVMVREPVYQEPAAPVYQQPEAPVYRQPEAPVYQQPEAPAYQQPVYEQPQAPVYQQPVVQSNPAADVYSTPILIFGILSVSFACIPYINFLGIIFAAIAKGKVKQFLAEGGVLAGKAKVGNILATVGLILGIIFTALFTILIILAVVGVLVENGVIG